MKNSKPFMNLVAFINIIIAIIATSTNSYSQARINRTPIYNLANPLVSNIFSANYSVAVATTPAGTVITPPADGTSQGRAGAVLTLTNTTWPMCVNWGFATVLPAINGASIGPPTYNNLNFDSGDANTDLAQGKMCFTGGTNYYYMNTAFNWINTSVPVRLRIVVTTLSDAPIPIEEAGSFLLIQAKQDFKVWFVFEAFGPTDALYFTGGGGYWRGAIDLFDALHTNSSYQILTSLDNDFYDIMDIGITAGAITNLVCSGNSIDLQGSTGNLDLGATSPTYLWAGPNSYSTTIQSPTIANATPSMSGIYSYAVSDKVCYGIDTVEVTVNDDVTPPNTPTLSDVTDECSVTLSIPTTTDNCAGTISGTTSTIFPITAQDTTIVTWTFDDGNGNSITADQKVIVDDVTPPETPTLADVADECSVTLSIPTTTDNCAGTISGTTSTTFPITAQDTTIVTWTFDDGNGNSITADQMVIVDDVTPPENLTLADVTDECSVTLSIPTTTDNCVGTISGTTSTTFPITAQDTTIVTWTFDDGNGNSITADQKVIVDDVTPPETPTLADVTDECSVSLSIPTTTDNCAGTISGTTTTVFPITVQGTTVVTWTFDDGNGNSITADQKVIIEDVTPPVTPFIADFTGECSVTPIHPTTTDNCAGIVTGTTTTSFPIVTIGTTKVTWTFDDGNGNMVTADQNIIVNIVTSPEAPVLADIIGECSVTPDLPIAYATCGFPIIGTTETTFPITSQGTTIITWTFDDGNGNSVTANQNVILDDVTNPETPELADVTGECFVTVSAPTTTDNCAGIITGTTSDPLTYSTQGTYVIDWIFDDGNGNSITVYQSVFVDDVTDPEIPILADVTGECSATASTPTTTDNCAGTLIGNTFDPLTYTTQGTHVIEWIFIDNNGNSITVNQNVIIDDITNPETPTLADVTGECSASVSSAPTTYDACAGTVTGTTSDPLTYSEQGTYSIAWSFDDGNGNSIVVNQNVIIDDVTNPETPELADITGECSASVSEAPTTSDDCTSTIIGTTSDPLTYSEQGTYSIAWTFDDGNGNSIVVIQNVIIDDITDPTINCIGNQTIALKQDESYYTVSGNEFDPIATDDNCGIASVINSFTNSETLNGASLPIGTTLITWTVKDVANNKRECSFNVQVNAFVGVESMQQKGISLFPNPTTGILNLEFTNNTIQQIKISDLRGKTIWLKDNIQPKETIDLSGFANGVYIVRIQTDNDVVTTHIVKE